MKEKISKDAEIVFVNLMDAFRPFVNGMSKEQMKDVFRGTGALFQEYWMKNSIENEDYEICQAIKEIIDERNG